MTSFKRIEMKISFLFEKPADKKIIQNLTNNDINFMLGVFHESSKLEALKVFRFPI